MARIISFVIILRTRVNYYINRIKILHRIFYLKISNLLKYTKREHMETLRDTTENTTRPNPAETIAMILEQFDLSALQEMGNDAVAAVREMRCGDEPLDETLEFT
jgi:hypothetical protein